MENFFLSIFLFLMVFPAILSVLLATRSWLAIAWNLSWFYLMGLIAQQVFASENGIWFGGIFAILYLWRALRNPGPNIKMYYRGIFGEQDGFRPARTFQTPRRAQRSFHHQEDDGLKSDQTIEAQYIDVTRNKETDI